SPTLLSTPILNRVEYFRESRRSYQTDVLRESSSPQDEDEHEPMFIQPHDPDIVPEPIYPEYIPLEDEHILPAKEQPLPPEYEDDETEDGPIDYPMDGGNDGDDDDGDSSGDNADDEDEDEEDEEEE
nr:hypothetical protein [Tanacetum cinerariifolium]